MKLEPLNKSSLSCQLYSITGKFYNSLDFERGENEVIELSTGRVFYLPTKEEEERFETEEAQRLETEKLEKSHRNDNKTAPFIDYNNPDRWKTGLVHAKSQGYPKTEMCEEAYWHFLECVPPMRMRKQQFVCGEPYTHNGQGEAIYLCGTQEGDEYFARYGTLKQFDSNQIF